MTRHMVSAIAAVCICTATVLAQSGATTATQAPRGGDAAGTIRVTGCVERADQVMPLGGAALGTTVDSQEFVLIHSQIAGSEPAAAAPSATGTSGLAATTGSKPDTLGEMFRLDGAAALLNPQVGHRVEVVGSREIAAAPAPARPDAANPSAVTAPLLRVASVKTVADTCPR